MLESGCSAESSEPYVLRVVGDSMAPEFEDGHIILIDPGLPARHGVYVVIDYGGEILFGQFRLEGRRHWLYYLNDAHEPVELLSPYTVKGVVTQRSTSRRKQTKYYE